VSVEAIKGPESGAAEAETLQSPEAELATAFSLCVREAVTRLAKIDPEERLSNTAFDRVARTALQFLRAAAQAHALAALIRKDDQENDAARPLRAPDAAEIEKFKQLLAAKIARRVGGRDGGGAEGQGDVSSRSGGAVS
jgi:hypothetical protein